MITSVVVGRGLSILLGEKWAAERKILTPFFHQDALQVHFSYTPPIFRYICIRTSRSMIDLYIAMCTTFRSTCSELMAGCSVRSFTRHRAGDGRGYGRRNGSMDQEVGAHSRRSWGLCEIDVQPDIHKISGRILSYTAIGGEMRCEVGKPAHAVTIFWVACSRLQPRME